MGAPEGVVSMKYDEAYRNNTNLFGADPEQILIKHYRKLDRSHPVLDVGAGQGRHSLFLARKGFGVDALDPSHVAIEAISTTAAAEKLTLQTHRCGFDEFRSEPSRFAGILVFGLIQELAWDSIRKLQSKIDTWIRKDGYIFVTCFTTADPAFTKNSTEWICIGKNSFRNKDGYIRTYLEPAETLELFSGYEVIYHREGMGPEHRHGDGPPERHHRAELVARSYGGNDSKSKKA